ncbi:MAG: TatD family hydrolase, partial [Bacilli bacterium]
DEQITNFIQQIHLANALKLPLIIHAKNTNKLVMEIIKKYKPLYGFVFHCFQPDLTILDDIIDLGGYVSVAKPITRPTANKSLQVIKIIPRDRLLIELDYPYLSDNPTLDGKNVFNVIKGIWNIPKSELEEQLDSNAKTLFKRLK